MSRAPQGEVIYVKPGSNAYTALSAVAFFLAALGLALLYFKATEQFPSDFSFFPQ